MARRQRAALVAGSLLSLAALLPPLSRLADQRLSLHMLEEMLLLALNLVLFGSQAPVVVDLAVKNAAFREATQAIFILGGFLFWSPIVSRNGLGAVAKIGCLMVAGVPPTIPGLTLALSHHPFYQAFHSLEDQQVAGLLLFGTAKFALITGTFVLLWRLLTPQPEPPDRDDETAYRGDLPPGAPAWLERLDEALPAEAGRPRLPVPSRL